MIIRLSRVNDNTNDNDNNNNNNNNNSNNSNNNNNNTCSWRFTMNNAKKKDWNVKLKNKII